MLCSYIFGDNRQNIEHSLDTSPSSHPLRRENVLQPALATAVSSPRTAPLIRFLTRKLQEKMGGYNRNILNNSTYIALLS